jgi:acid phosphatase (class A)
MAGTLWGSASAQSTHYVDPHQIDLAALLAPPPDPSSAVQQADLDRLLDVQRSRTPEQVQRAQADTQKSVFRFADVLGPRFTAENLPKTAALFKAAASDAAAIAKQGKDHFRRMRPYLVSDKVHPSIALDPKDIDNSYPSGHATFGYMSAILLAQMVPEKRAALFARGREYGENRIVDGVHYPSDIEAGRIDGTIVAQALMNNAEFRQAFAEARAEVRQALDLPLP